ncbi:MAG: hypothetical protein ABIH46_00760 [Chloroflexota bacterium]
MESIEDALTNSLPLQIIIDLSNSDKHGPPRDGGLSEKAPTLVDLNRVLQVTTGGKSGSGVGVIFTRQGPKQAGSGSTSVVITGQVVDSNGVLIGDLNKLEIEALETWERVCEAYGLFV